MFLKKSKKTHSNIWKKILGWSSISLLMLGGLSGVATSGYYMSQDSHLGSDFGSGTSFDIQLSLDGIPIDEKEKVIKESADSLERILNNLGLSQVLVNTGTSTIKNNQTGNIDKEFGVLSASFDTSSEIFGLLDIEESDNDIVNNFKIYKQALNSYNVELENIGINYPGTNNKSTGRADGNKGIIADEVTPVNSYILNDDKNYKSLNTNEGKYYTSNNELINIGEAVQIDLPNKPSSTTASHVFDTSNFVKDKNLYDKSIIPPEPPPEAVNKTTGGEGETSPDLTNAFQTHQSWFLWKDKSYFINKLNNLIFASLYNEYANGRRTNIGETNVTDQRWFIIPEVNGKINSYLQTLNGVEKLFVEFVGDPVYSNLIVTEDNLMTILYEFYNSEIFAPNNSYKVDIATTPPTNKQYSASIINGWYFLESDNTDLNDLYGSSLYGIIDYRNYDDYFFDDNNIVIQNDDEPILEFDDTSIRLKPDSRIDLTNFSPTVLKNKLLYTRIPIDYGNYSRDLISLLNSYREISTTPKPTDLVIADKLKKDMGNLFGSNTLLSFSGSNISTLPKTLVTLTAFEFFIFSLIILILTIGIIISVLYRFPGFMSFITTASAFGFSVLFFNLFGLTFNFYVYAALFASTFINFFIPFLLFKNVKKEIVQGSIVVPAFQKSMLKYSKMFLDIYVVQIIISLSFFFFSNAQISSFGAMLVVSGLVSLFFNYILLYLLLLILIRIYTHKSDFLFVSKKILLINNEINSESLVDDSMKTNLEDSKFKGILRSKHFFTINLFKKRNMFIAIFPFIIAIVGFILFLSLPNGMPIDNGSSSTLIVNNLDIIGLEVTDILRLLGLSGAEYSLNENQLVIYIPDSYKLPVDLVNPLLANNINIFNLKYLANENLLISLSSGIFISMMFLIVWSIISLNIISVVPILIINIFSTGVSLLLSWFLIDLIGIESMAFVSIIYVLNSICSFIIVSALKSSWNRKKIVSNDSLKEIITQIVARLKPTFIIWNIILLSFSLLMSFLGIINLIIGFLLIFINSIISYLINLYILPQLWYIFVILRDKYQNEINNISNKRIRPSSYDILDEQNVKGINHH